MDTAARLLTLLTLLTSRPSWRGDELAERLAVTPRTLRRDVNRLREVGYPIEGTAGHDGGYRLGAGGRLPPLLLDERESVAVAVGLRAAAGAGASGIQEAVLSALAKLDRLLPPRLHEQVDALREVAVDLRRVPVPLADADTLIALALACARPERITFTYVDADGNDTHRAVEPYRLVYTKQRWYLVAHDRDRRAWRSFRVDRLHDLVASGIPFTHRDVPDAAALVAEGIAGASFRHDLALVRLHCRRDHAERIIDPTLATIVADDATTTTIRIGGRPEWIARNLAALDVPFDVVESDAVRAALRALGRRLQRHR